MELEDLKLLAAANPSGPAALRLTWLKARALGASRDQLFELIRQCCERRFLIPEIDAYIAEQFAGARRWLENARQCGSVSTRQLQALEEAIQSGESALVALRARPL